MPVPDEASVGACGKESLLAASVDDCTASEASGIEGRDVSKPDPVAFDLIALAAAAAAATQLPVSCTHDSMFTPTVSHSFTILSVKTLNVRTY